MMILRYVMSFQFSTKVEGNTRFAVHQRALVRRAVAQLMKMEKKQRNQMRKCLAYLAAIVVGLVNIVVALDCFLEIGQLIVADAFGLFHDFLTSSCSSGWMKTNLWKLMLAGTAALVVIVVQLSQSSKYFRHSPRAEKLKSPVVLQNYH